MPRKSQAFHPGVSLLESKLLLSSMRSGPAEVAPLFNAGPRGMNNLAGQYLSVEVPRSMDFPQEATINARGLVQGLGRTRLSGSLALGGFRATNQDATGTVTLSTPRGTMTVRLSGTGGNDWAPGSTLNLTAAVESGTGAYKNVRRIGTATVSFGTGITQKGVPVSPGSFLAQITDHVDETRGSLTVRLNLEPPARHWSLGGPVAFAR